MGPGVYQEIKGPDPLASPGMAWLGRMLAGMTTVALNLIRGSSSILSIVAEASLSHRAVMHNERQAENLCWQKSRKASTSFPPAAPLLLSSVLLWPWKLCVCTQLLECPARPGAALKAWHSATNEPMYHDRNSTRLSPLGLHPIGGEWAFDSLPMELSRVPPHHVHRCMGSRMSETSIRR
jgi:hypothetical protein